MIEKEDINKKTVTDRTTSTEDKKDSTHSGSSVRNPLEDGNREISQEEMDSVEQFKEAQTERD